jgi:acetyl-CoA carboxylase carboxyl transferase subunit alpha
MDPNRRGWGAFGAYALSGELPRERDLSLIEKRIAHLRAGRDVNSEQVSSELVALRGEWERAAARAFAELEPWETVFLARHPKRPVIRDYIDQVVSEFCELHGDRYFGDDRAMVTGLGRIGQHQVMIVGHDRGRSLEDRIACNFGCANPEGYRKALAKMQLAGKFGIPIVTFIDTPGAYPGMEAEQRGIARAIAANLVAMPKLRVPIVSVVIGEGGSGGALGIGVADHLAMLEHSIFSVISPEGCAAILWKTSTDAKLAAAALKLRAEDLRELELVDEVIGEPRGGAHRCPREAICAVETSLICALNALKRLSGDELVAARYGRLRRLGLPFVEGSE